MQRQERLQDLRNFPSDVSEFLLQVIQEIH